MEDEIVKLEKDDAHVFIVGRKDIVKQFLHDLWHNEDYKWSADGDDE